MNKKPISDFFERIDGSINDFTDSAIKNFGRGAGLSIYFVAKRTAEMINTSAPKSSISPETTSRIGIFYPQIDLNKVVVFENAKLPANLFKANIDGMTFGNSIYTTHKNCQADYYGILNLMHELIHVEQINALGEKEFAKQYGQQFISCGGYGEKMPFEGEAYSFIRNLPFEPIYYLRANPDVEKLVQASKSGAFFHWLDNGVDEGRQACSIFKPSVYLAKNPDIEAICGKGNYKAAIRHWARTGRKEARKGI